MAAFSTTTTSLQAIASVAASSVGISSELDISTCLGGNLSLRFGRRSATAAGAGVNFRCDYSPETTGNSSWVSFPLFVSAFAACEAEAVSGTVGSGTNVITVASTTNLVAGDLIFIDNGTITLSEWGRIKSISANVSVTIEDNLTNAQTGATLYDAAEIYTPALILSGYKRLRIVADGSLFTQAFAWEAKATLITGIA